VLDSTETQVAYNYFSDTFMSLYDLYFPPTTKKLNPNFSKLEPWFSKGLQVSRKTKLSLSKTASCIPTVVNINKYKAYRNLYNRVVRASKKLFYETELIANQSNLKRTWELVRSAANMPSKNRDSISQISVDQQIIADPLTIATKFNEFFTTMPSKIVNEIVTRLVSRNLRTLFHLGLLSSALQTPLFRSLKFVTLLINCSQKNRKTSMGFPCFLLKESLNLFLSP
jgi:hypothetical protein